MPEDAELRVALEDELMNHALVTVAVAPQEQGTRVRIGAYALEGLLKQHAARKAATRVADVLGAESR